MLRNVTLNTSKLEAIDLKKQDTNELYVFVVHELKIYILSMII